MLKTPIQLSALSLFAACTGGFNLEAQRVADPPTVIHDVTERGVVESADPGDTTLATTPTSWLELRTPDNVPTYLPGRAQAIDLSTYHFGRGGLAEPTKPTAVGVELVGLDWHQGDTLQLVSPNAGLSIHELEVHFDYPSEGATSITANPFDWRDAHSPLLDASKGDTTYLMQMSNRPTASGTYYSVVSRAGVAGGYSQTDGAASRLAATLAPVTPDRTLAFKWKGTAYAALAAEAGPGARPAPAPSLTVRTLPDMLARNTDAFARDYMYLPSLVDFGPVRGNEDFAETIHYGNPLATRTSPWTDFVAMVYAMPVIVPDVGGTHAFIVQTMPVGGGEMAPAISPVRNVRINGESADVPRTGVGGTPTISWDAPSLGKASSYAVTIQPIVRDGAGFRITASSTFRTTATSLKLPAFATGAGSYVLTVTAISSGDRDLTTRPLIGSLPYASADHVTAQITE